MDRVPVVGRKSSESLPLSNENSLDDVRELCMKLVIDNYGAIEREFLETVAKIVDDMIVKKS